MTNTDAAADRRRVEELEQALADAQVAEVSERDRRLAAEASRDQWYAIALLQKIDPSKRNLGNPELAVDAAYAQADRTRRELNRAQDRILSQANLLDGLVRWIRTVPKLPVPVAKLHPDTALALRWALHDHHGMVLDPPALPKDVVDALDAVAAHWADVRRYAMAKVHGDPNPAPTAGPDHRGRVD